MRASKAFFYFWTISFVIASALYLPLSFIMPHGYVFGALYGMFLYHWDHPYQYIALITFVYAVIASAWCVFYSWPTTCKRQILAWLIISALTTLVASVPGGILWTLHDMQAGFFTKDSRFWNDLLNGALTGLQVGWLVIALSIPYNIIGLILGYFINARGMMQYGRR